jgi:hypothetical protein|tara:strand:- start:149 stop:472 length:324 start_codon:yes stop_codon:yes gene_type:complete
VVTSLLTTVVCLPFIAIGMALNFLPGQGAGELVEPLTVIASTSSNAFAYGTSLFLTQFSDFIQGLFAGQILVGPLFTNFMLVTVLGLVALKLFLSLSLYETKLVPTR